MKDLEKKYNKAMEEYNNGEYETIATIKSYPKVNRVEVIQKDFYQTKSTMKLKVIPNDRKGIRRDSPVLVVIPNKLWDKWYKRVVENMKSENPDPKYMYDVVESQECGLISPGHLKAILEWRNDTTEYDTSFTP